MKKKWAFITAGMLLFSVPAYCDLFGIPGLPQIVWDPTTAADVVKDVEALQQLLQLEAIVRSSITNIDSAFKTGNWQLALQSVMFGAAATTQTLGSGPNGRNSQTLDQIKRNIQLAQIALQEATLASGLGHPSTGNAIAMTQLALQQLELQMKHDSLTANLQYAATVQANLSKIPDASNFNAGAGGWVPQ